MKTSRRHFFSDSEIASIDHSSQICIFSCSYEMQSFFAEIFDATMTYIFVNQGQV
jgi:hypothetical protein